MSGKKILVIDDSATIRRLVDSYLSSANYQVLLAATAEEGLQLAKEKQPDLILLDHQLPGTTGCEVCRQLNELPSMRQTPVVVSSTLRKRAYVEYADLPNVVDMLPKPYSAELLKTTVANALETGAMVVQSQEQGTAVPEVMQAIAEPALSGDFHHFRLRELLDFLNNGGKTGVLEVEASCRRTYYHLDKGRIAGVTSSGVEASDLIQRLPASLQSLGPVLHLTLGSRASSEVEGIVELLDRKVLDPRLLRTLLRQQAALLTFDCFTQELAGFRFQPGDTTPPLQRKLPLDVSLAALLIDGSLLCDAGRLPTPCDEERFARRTVRGQNADRAGLSAQHMKLLNFISEPRSVTELTRQSALDAEEVRRVLFALMLLEAVEVQPATPSRCVVAFETNPDAAGGLRQFFESGVEGFQGKVVKDTLALQLVLRRTRPDVLLISVAGEESAQFCRELQRSGHESLAQTKWVAIVPGETQENDCLRWSARLNVRLDAVVPQSCHPEHLQSTLQQLFAHPDRERMPRSQTADELATAARHISPKPSGSERYDYPLYAAEV